MMASKRVAIDVTDLALGCDESNRSTTLSRGDLVTVGNEKDYRSVSRFLNSIASMCTGYSY